MRSIVIAACAIGMFACQPQPAQTISNTTPATAPRADSCRDDIPDCVAVCALRETHRTDYIDFYERRCAAVVLGKNPDKVEPLQATPYASANVATSGSEFPPSTRDSLSLPPPPFDPNAVTRTGVAEPAECKAARMLRAQKRDREADMLTALCIAKGGDAGS
jgi:hypothetical protein